MNWVHELWADWEKNLHESASQSLLSQQIRELIGQYWKSCCFCCCCVQFINCKLEFSLVTKLKCQFINSYQEFTGYSKIPKYTRTGMYTRSSTSVYIYISMAIARMSIAARPSWVNRAIEHMLRCPLNRRSLTWWSCPWATVYGCRLKPASMTLNALLRA